MTTHTAPTKASGDSAQARASLETWASAQTCPCGHRGLRIEWRIAARPVGDYSLAGVQTKFSANEVPFLCCDGCGSEAKGHY